MDKYKIFEQLRQDETKEPWKAITNPVLRTAAASGCFPEGYQITIHPDNGLETISAISKKPENQANKFVYYKPDYTLDYRTSIDKTGKTVRTAKWTCYSLLNRTNPETAPIEKELLNALKTNLKWEFFGDVDGATITNYQLTDVVTDPDLKEGGMYYNLVSGIPQYMESLKLANRPFYMWKPKKRSADLKLMKTEQDRVLALFPDYSICDVSAVESGDYDTIDIDLKYPKFFEKGTKLCKKIENLPANLSVSTQLALVTELSKDFERNNCRKLISHYYDGIKRIIPMSEKNLLQIKPTVKRCSTSFKFPGLKNKIDYMQRIKVRGNNNQIINYGLSESTTDNLSTIVTESLNRVKKEKLRKVISESTIVRNRLELIFENREIRSRRDIRMVSDYLIGEMVNLRNEGYSEEVISEQWTDFLKGAMGFLGGSNKEGSDMLSSLGSAAKGGILSTVVETIGSGLLKTMGINPTGTIGTMILKTLSNLTPEDLPKLTDCHYLSGLFTKSILETLAAQLTKDIGGTSMFGSFLQNTLFEAGEDSEIGQSIKNYLGDKIICPYLEGKGSDILSKSFSEIFGK